MRRKGTDDYVPGHGDARYDVEHYDLVLDYNRMARRVLDGALADLFGQRLEQVIDTPEAEGLDDGDDGDNAEDGHHVQH